MRRSFAQTVLARPSMPKPSKYRSIKTSLDGIKFASRKEAWTINIPMPPSVNAMFVNRGREGMRGRMVSPAYAAWRKQADDALWTQAPIRHFCGEVAVCIALGPTKGLSDIDGRLKAPFDFLVRHKIIEDDNSKYVRMILAVWDDAIPGCRITISSMGYL